MSATNVIQRRSGLAWLTAATAVGAFGLAAGGTAGALVAEDMTSSTAWAGVPLGVLVVGSAAGALLIARRTTRAGRAAGLMLGYAIGAVGAVIVVAAAAIDDFVLLLVGSAALGAANAAIFLSRYAAAELGGTARRGRALGIVFFAAAFGAVASPNMLGPSGSVAEAIGLPELAGLYLVAVPAFGVAALLLTRLPSRSTSVDGMEDVSRSSLRAGLRDARVGLAVLGSVNLVMVAVMAIAPIHLVEHGHDLDFVGVVVSVHVLCMFGPSPLTGWLADRVGGAFVVVLSAALLVTAGISGAMLDTSDAPAMTLMLAVLGLGWNAGVVGGSTMLAASTPPELRPHAEAIGETAMGLAAGAGAPIAGLIVAYGDFATLSLAGALGGLLVLGALGLGGLPPRRRLRVT
jgi:MFS family permease